MLDKSVVKPMVSFLLGLIVASAAQAGNNSGGLDGARSEPQEATFSLTRLPDNARQYSLVISDGDEQTISGNFSVDQLQILRAIMFEAEKFALNGEAAGTKDSITTRFTDRQESAFIVDVEKLGTQSRLFFTLKTEIGRITLNAGKIIRTTRREEGFFFDLLLRLESVLPKLPGQPGKLTPPQHLVKIQPIVLSGSSIGQ
jgi:hypothetical protein